MKMYLLSDNVDTLTGMRLAGISGRIVHEEGELKKEIDLLLQDKEVAIILVSEGLVKLFPKAIDDIKLKMRMPLVVEIPDRHGSGREKGFITNYIKEAIGVKL